MIPVDQDKFGMPHGNCMAACVASVLELPLAEVPNFVEFGEEWWAKLVEFLASRSCAVVWCRREAHACQQIDLHPIVSAGHFLIVSGPSPRGDFLHCVIEHRGAIVHDPHPSRAGIGKPWHDVMIIVPNTLAA